MTDMSKNLFYTKSHEWIENAGDGTATVGITDHAQAALGDLVFVELPETGTAVSVGDVVAVIESVKAASDIYAPLDGKITGINEQLTETPDLVNEDPLGKGWLFKVSIDNEEALGDLLNADAYQQIVEDAED